MRELDDWLAAAQARGFPYDTVIEEYHRVGKHFVPDQVLASLDSARESVRLLAKFLDTALDKWDGRYDYRTYLALDLLPLPGTGDDTDPESALRQHDRLVVQLIADLLRFEFDALDGRTERFPEQRPDAATVAKRSRLALRAVTPLNRRLGVPAPENDRDPVAAAREFHELVAKDRTAAEEQVLSLTNLPVYIVHDEYMFIRILQAFETTFALLAVDLRSSIKDIAAGRIAEASQLLHVARTALREAARLFSLLATMRVESFHTFRVYTEGASAIQSRNYKTVEALCRTPDESRVDSPAFLSAPEVRATVLAGQATLDGVLRDALADEKIRPADLVELQEVMRSFAATLSQWRQTHYSLAVRMLGQLGGTGYTEGTPYLDRARTIPVFHGAGDGEVKRS